VIRVLIIVQNLAIPFDRRVCLEWQALVSDGCLAVYRRVIGDRTTERTWN
jgi:hypothetical protein